MTTNVKLMGLLTFESDFDGVIEVDKEYTIKKDGYRIVPFGAPMELADCNYNYLGKAVVVKILVENGFTWITFKVLKVFTEAEAKVFTDNFIKY